MLKKLMKDPTMPLFAVFVGLAVYLNQTGQTYGQGYLSQALDALPLEMFGTPQFVFDTLNKVGVVWGLMKCLPGPLRKLVPSQLQGVGDKTACCLKFGYAAMLYAQGFQCFNAGVVCVMCLLHGFAFEAHKNNRPWLGVRSLLFILRLETLNAGISKISNYESVLFATCWVYGMLCAKGGRGGAAAGGKRGRTRSRSKRR